jgi:hypothetical protein
MMPAPVISVSAALAWHSRVVALGATVCRGQTGQDPQQPNVRHRPAPQTGGVGAGAAAMAVSERQGRALSEDQVKRVPRNSFSMPCETCDPWRGTRIPSTGAIGDPTSDSPTTSPGTRGRKASQLARSSRPRHGTYRNSPQELAREGMFGALSDNAGEGQDGVDLGPERVSSPPRCFKRRSIGALSALTIVSKATKPW